ncbi:hypothetical protein [Frankia sp. Cas3]|uniref:hypothetical protein n=1 Tax=Frankia sp. Cas3 TaxID=3073926 RepID=UPI002AD48461|nr:hypothetical protein [Frankia sp. Cas3]
METDRPATSDTPAASDALDTPAASDTEAARSSAPAGLARPKGSAGIGSIFTLAFLVILVPGVAAYAVARVAGLAIGPAGLLGLLVMFICLGLYPSVLQRLGWVRRRTRRPR